MRKETVWSWRMTSEITGKKYRARWKMTEEAARRIDPNAERLPLSEKVREIAETADEIAARSHSTRHFK